MQRVEQTSHGDCPSAPGRGTGAGFAGGAPQGGPRADGEPGDGGGGRSCPCAPSNSCTYLHTRVREGIFPYPPAAPTFRRTNARANPRTQIHAQKRCTRGLGDTAGLRGAGCTPSLHLHPRQSSGCAAWAAVPRVPLCQPKIQKPGKGKALLPRRTLHPLEVGKVLGGRSQRRAPAPYPGRAGCPPPRAPPPARRSPAERPRPQPRPRRHPAGPGGESIPDSSLGCAAPRAETEAG